ncbi:MAG: DUF4325 domain-containing protein [Planctomycetes bacterium]|nr:DUF4325 domain-containing protein [Planctomycetota bacterium]
MGLEEVLESGASTTHWDDDTRNTGLHVIRAHRDVDRFLASAARLQFLNDETKDALKYGMAELGRNVVQHAWSDIGGVAIAQYFPDRKHVQIAIVDNGRGVKAALADQYPEVRTHLESVKLALLPHVSGAVSVGPYGSSDNAGLGLFFCKEICWRSGGSLWLGSFDALVGIRDNDESARKRVYRRINPWPGTFVVMDFPANGVVDFGNLLEVCQSLAADARRASGPAALDFLAHAPELDDAETVRVVEFVENVEQAGKVRDCVLMPRINDGKTVILDFLGIRFVTQSFAHALLNDVLRIPGSLMRLVFVNCTKATEQAIRTVAAYAASYRQHLD